VNEDRERSSGLKRITDPWSPCPDPIGHLAQCFPKVFSRGTLLALKENEGGHVALTGNCWNRYMRSVDWKKGEDRLLKEDRERSVWTVTIYGSADSMFGSHLDQCCPNVFGRGTLLASKNNNGSSHSCSRKYRPTVW